MKESAIHYKQILDYDRVLDVVGKTISTSSFYWQSLSIIACFIIAYFAYKKSLKVLQKKFAKGWLQNELVTKSFVVRYITPNLYPLLSVLLLCQADLIFSQFFREAIIFITIIKLITLFLFLSFIRISSANNWMANVAGIFLIPALILDIFDALDLTTKFLDQFAIEMGSLRISLYLSIKAMVVVLIVAWFANLVRRKSKSYIDSHANITSSTKTILGKVIDILVYITIALVLLNMLGVDMKTFAFIGGAVGVGVGLGLQKIASNFISGAVLLFEKSIKVGDIVELDSGRIYGTIKHFSARYTLVETMDGKEIMIPNEEIIVNRVANWTFSNNRARIEIAVGIAYDSDVAKAREIMIEIAKKHPRCLKHPEVECYVTEFGTYDIKMMLQFWIGNIADGRSQPKSEVMIEILNHFKQQNIEIPFPRQDMKVLNQA